MACHVDKPGIDNSAPFSERRDDVAGCSQLLRAWAILTVLWIVAVGWETYRNLPPSGAIRVAATTGSSDYSRADVIKIGAAFAFAPPALIFVSGARLFRALRGSR